MRKKINDIRVKLDTENRNEVIKLVVEFFDGNTDKAQIWMKAYNPMLGGVTPEFMIRIGRSSRLLKWVRHAISENKPREA